MAVDGAGVLHVVTGRRSIARMAKLFDVGNRRRMATMWAQVGVLFVVGCGVPVAVLVLIGHPVPSVAYLSLLGYAMLDFTRHVVVVLLAGGRPGRRMLDSSVMLPLLALYAHHEGWERAVRGLAANELVATVNAHPEDLETVARYRATTQKLEKLAHAVGGAGAGTSFLR